MAELFISEALADMKIQTFVVKVNKKKLLSRILKVKSLELRYLIVR